MSKAGSIGREVADECDLQDDSIHSRTLDIGGLEAKSLDELRSRWTSTFGIEPLSRLSRELLIRGIAYRLQERARGGTSRKVLRKLQQIAHGDDASHGVGTASAARPGTRLVREWQGSAHEVVALEHGFLWNGNTYQSLSEIARLITGTRWSGPRFFGLKDEKGERRKTNG